jgi:hypothetical protein
MELSSIQHIEPENLPDIQADLFITTLSHESRCTSIAKNLDKISCRKVALTGTGQIKDFAFKENLIYYEEHGFEVITVENDVPGIDSIFGDLYTGEINIIIDCTSMSQPWYYEFFRWFAEDQDRFEKARMRFAYTMAGYVDEGVSRKVKEVKEFLKTENRTKKKKKALILGLGHEPNVSETIIRIVKPDLVYLFYADPPVDKRFVEKVFVNNHAIIKDVPIRNLVSYPINNGRIIYQSLIDTVLPIRNEYSIILIPQGPKIFSVASMLVQMGYPDVVISYPRFKKTPVTDRQPCGEPVVLDVHFEEEE